MNKGALELWTVHFGGMAGQSKDSYTQVDARMRHLPKHQIIQLVREFVKQ
jgi:hypothetical protein